MYCWLVTANQLFCTFRHTIYCIKDGQPCMDHDRQSGEVRPPYYVTCNEVHYLGSGTSRVHLNQDEDGWALSRKTEVCKLVVYSKTCWDVHFLNTCVPVQPTEVFRYVVIWTREPRGGWTCCFMYGCLRKFQSKNTVCTWLVRWNYTGLKMSFTKQSTVSEEGGHALSAT